LPWLELIEVGKVEDANQALYDIITDNQTRRRQWSKTYEEIMMKLMELSVQLRKPLMVKEALHKYRATCMQSNVSSLDDVVRYLVKISEKRTEEARSKVDSDAVALGAEDLEDDAMETPDTLILEAAGNALTKERVDRQEVVPWMRFLWEVYRVTLDIVKSHSKLEVCYHEVAERAFAFCGKYKRFMEFRRLCDMLRQHMNQLIHYPRTAPNDVKITDADTLQKFLETRFTQLSSAVSLEHWQEAYRTIVDIHAIMSMSKSRPRPQHMSIFYDKLMQVFWVSGNYLYHAHALWKLYTLSVKQNRNLSAEDTKTLASRLMLAALSIPVYDAQSAVLSDSYGVMTDVLGTPMSENAARHARMASLLNYPAAAERDTLISELVNKGVANACHEELKDMYELLEGEMAPLRFSDRTKKILAFVETNPALAPYVGPLRRVAIYRLLEQLGRVYDVMHLEDMKRVASFATYDEVEDTALTALKTRSLALRFDHQNQCLRFGSELFSTDGMRSQLGQLARRMALASKMLMNKSLAAAETASDREVVALNIEREKATSSRRLAAIAAAKLASRDEEEAILARRNLIERRKEEAERRTAEAVRQKKQAVAREMAAAERSRKAVEAKRRYDEQQAREARAAAGEQPVSVSMGGGGGGIVGAEDEEGDTEREARMTREREQELKSQREMEKGIQQLALHMNYVERTMRQAQWDKLKELHEAEAEQQSVQTQEMAAREREEAQKAHAEALVAKARTERIMPELEIYLTDLMGRVDQDFERWIQNEQMRTAAIAKQEAEERIAREAEERRAAEVAERARIAREKAEEEERLKAESAEKERLRAETGGKYRPSVLRAGRTPGEGVLPPPPPSRNGGSGFSGIADGPPGVSAAGGRPKFSNSRLQDRQQEVDSRQAAFKSFGSSRRDREEEDGRGSVPPPGAPTNGVADSSSSGRRPRFINSKKNQT
jgi:translation initiation factor 3 subunit A